MGYCANYKRYDDSSQYPTYTTASNVYSENQFPYKTNYGADIASYSESNKYPNYKSVYSTGSSNTNYQSGYSTPNYGRGYGYGGQYSQGVSPYEVPYVGYNSDYCVNRSPQQGIFVNDLGGMWYGVELIQHLSGDPGVDYEMRCISVHISEPQEKPSTENQLYHVQSIMAKFNQQHRHLRLLWDENGHMTEYSLFFRNESAGYWETFDKQNGSLAARPHYQQFTGTVQVLKAVKDHLVLNFCQAASNGAPAQLYSVLFSREPGPMPQWAITAVHNLLQTKNLSIASRRMVCGNGADKPMLSLLFSFMSCVLAYVSLS
ncbi:jg23771 [Pararge aegeria aegeria]|uniref:Jg23771 protein n=1 Tax=Pararge aegeria aegeria TaxID=348720 RepID=A0A8S4SP21_9NEOP|nr:jg23771 [Pararge aegeria aegeria]